jgi:hypothetical protein
MRIAYVTTDEVNQDLALRTATDWGACLEVLSVQEALPNGHYDAVVYDWDFLPRDCREKVLAGLAKAPRNFVVALHSYGLQEREARALRRRGLLIFRRLRGSLFRKVRREVPGAQRPRRPTARFVPADLLAIMSEDCECLHDQIAETKVIDGPMLRFLIFLSGIGDGENNPW